MQNDNSMEKEQFKRIIFPDHSKPLSVTETSISWILFSENRAFKIKRPVETSFLNFTSLEYRKFYCEKELLLNQRFASDIYISVHPVRLHNDYFQIGGEDGKIVDYAVEMRRLPEGKELNNLLLKNEITERDIRNIAEVIAEFHFSSKPLIIKNQSDLIKDKTKDILNYSAIFNQIDPVCNDFIEISTSYCLQFIQHFKEFLESRMQQEFIRDCHGDLHTGNIFLLDKPLLFDCIEFSDSLRQIDIMEELAFLSMDLDSYGRKDFGTLVLEYYNVFNPTVRSPEEYMLFLFYKYYKAGVRAKVMAVQWIREKDRACKVQIETQMKAYIKLMQSYFNQLQKDSNISDPQVFPTTIR
jgi:aminoglycoside phosphotransferase family enzyme